MNMTTNESAPAEEYDCTGYTFAVQKTGQIWLGSNDKGELSQLVLTAVYPEEEPPAAVIFANFSGDELIQEGASFTENEPQEFAGVGTLTLLELHGGTTARFCFEPADGFTPDEHLTN